jgi:hypothetical protein
MGGIDKGHLYHYKALLRLSDEAMELADRHSIDEKKLRYVVSMSPEFHSEIVRQIIDFNLTSKQVKELYVVKRNGTERGVCEETLSPDYNPCF